MPRNVRKTVDSEREPSLSVVVPTYRRPAVLHRLLSALEQQVTGNPNYSVVVINDGSHDDAYAKVVERFQSMIDYVALPENHGPGAARNAGAKKATGRFLVFTDDDCVPPPHWLDWLAAILQEHPYVAVLGGWARPLPSASPGWTEQFRIAHKRYPKPEVWDGEVLLLPTVNLAVRRDWFEKIGGFDERLRIAGEDLNLTYRLKRAGAPLHVDPAWFTQHDLRSGLFEHWRRYFRYGYGTAQHALLAEDDTYFAHNPSDTLRSITGKFLFVSSSCLGSCVMSS